jgi:hypothetical protein
LRPDGANKEYDTIKADQAQFDVVRSNNSGEGADQNNASDAESNRRLAVRENEFTDE